MQKEAGTYDNDEGARPSSLRAVHKHAAHDPHYDAQLRRELELINALTRSEFGPRLPGGMPVEPKRKPNLPKASPASDTPGQEFREKETMNIQHLAMAAAVSMAAGCTSGIHAEGDGPKVERDAFYKGDYVRRVDPRYIPPEVKNGVLVMPFYAHSFLGRCYDTLKCRITYANSYIADEDEPSGPFTDYIRENLSGSWLGIENFPAPARVAWISKDGMSHEAEIDMSEIFRSRRIRYASDLNVNEVDLDVYHNHPAIILVVEGRSIHVYMRAHISLLHPVDPLNAVTNYRNDLVLAYTKKF